MYQWEVGREGKPSQKKSSHNSGSLTFHGSETFPTAFESIPQGMIRPTTVDTLKNKMGFTALLPTQARCYSHIFKGTDTVLHSRTGTGKSLAFILPLIERHVTDVERQREERTGPWMVVALPTVELAAQIQRVITEVYYPSSSSSKQQPGKKSSKKTSSTAEDGEEEEPAPKVSSSSPSSTAPTLYGVRTLVAGLDAISEEDVMTRCDILVGTVGAIDKLLRYKVDENGKRVASSSSSSDKNKNKLSQNGEDNDDESSSEDEDSDDDDEEFVDEKAAQSRNTKSNVNNNNNNNNNKKSDDDRRRTRSAENSNDNGGKKPENNAKRNRHASKKRFAASPAARFIRCFVIDEVDHTLGPKFSTSAQRVHKLLKTLKSSSAIFPSGRGGMQFVLVGATIPDWIQRVGFLGDPNRRVTYRLVSAGTSKLPADLKCYSVECSREQDHRVSMTCRLLKQLAPKRVVVFAPTKLVELIAASKFGPKSTINIRRLDSAADEVERLRVIEEFNQGVANVLVCTDRASRGLDFTNIDTVISTSFPPAAPTSAETFVHRAGRAGRAGKPGNCITLIDSTHTGETQSKKMIESSVHVVFRAFAVSVGANEVEPATQHSSGKFGGNNNNNNNNENQNSSSNKKKNTSSTASADLKNSDVEITCQLKVKNPFKAGNNNNNSNTQKPNPNRKTPKQIIESTLDTDLLKKVKFVENDDASIDPSEVVRFKVSQLLIADIRSALWKYEVTIV